MVDFTPHCRCDICPIAQAGGRRPVLGDGPSKARVFLVGEAPGRNEVARGVPFIGMSGQLLNKVLTQVGMPREEVYVTNATLCVPPTGGVNNKPPLAAIRACNGRLRAEIESVDPELIIPMGATAIQALGINARNITDIQGGLFWEESILGGKGRWVAPSFHPAYILRNPTSFTALRNAIRRGIEAVQTGEWPLKDFTYEWEHITLDDKESQERAHEVLQEIGRGLWGPILAFDVETASVRQRSQLIQLALANETKAVVIDADVFQGGAEEEALFEALSTPTLTWLMHNMSFDLQHLYRNFFIHHTDIPNVVDTMMLAMGVTEEGGRIGLKALASQYFAAPRYEEELSPYLKSKATPFTAIPRPILAKYASADVIYTRRLYPVLMEATHRAGTFDLCMGLLQDAQKMFADVEYDGVAIDFSKVAELRKEWRPKINSLLQEIQSWARDHGWDDQWGLNPDSPPQMERFLYDINRLKPPQTTEMNSKGQRKRKTGKEWRELYEGDPKWGEFIGLLDDYKLATKLMRTYIEGIVDDIDRDTGRVHPSFKLWGTVTGRSTIENPPLQTIPRKSTDDTFGSTRALFIAKRREPEEVGPQPFDLSWPEDEDVVFIAADYGQLELRTAWLMSGDPKMGADLLSGDFHTQTASRIFNIPVEEVTYEERHNSKYISFGISYGREAYSMALGQFRKKGRSHADNLAEAQFYYDRWRETYSVYWEARERLWEQAQVTGIIRTPFGRVRRFPLRFEPGSKEWRDLRNQSYNFWPQSVASDVNLTAAIKLNQELRSRQIGRLLFLVHDSITAEVRATALDETVELFRCHMMTIPPCLIEYGLPPEFELTVDIEVGKSWGGAKSWEAQTALSL